MKTITKLMALCLLCGSLGFAQAAAPAQDDKKAPADDKGAAAAPAGDKDTKAKKHKKAKKDKDKDKDAQKDAGGAAPEKK